VTGIVRVEQAAYRYPQNDYGLAPVSLSIGPGESVFVTGPSGCGKSTLARCLTGLIPHLYHGHLTGEVWLDGLRTRDERLWRLAERAGLVFQNPAAQMLAVSVEEEVIFGLENLGLPRDVIRERLEATLTRFGLQALRNRSPHTLSGGEQQKLALAAIVARQPPVLVLDEPLSMLDTSAAAELIDHLADLARAGTAVVICEHRSEPVRQIPDLRTIDLDGQAQGGQVQDLPLPPSDGPPASCRHSILRPPPSNGPPASCRHFALHPPTSDGPPASCRHSTLQLTVSDLEVRLGGRPILPGLSFLAHGGQVLAVVGRNGVGKTTLLRALAGLQKHTGSVTVDGGPPDLGMVFQNADLQLFNASVREEILFRVPDPDMARYAWLLDLLGLGRYEAVPPLLLSEGEKKRVALATVLMRGPRHGVLLDEPALGQDAAHKSRLIRLARALAEAGQLVILTTHDLGLAAGADRLLLLGPEGFVADGPPAQVLRDDGAWARLGLLVPDWVREGVTE